MYRFNLALIKKVNQYKTDNYQKYKFIADDIVIIK